MSYEFGCGKFYAIMGRSGAGKSTLLNIIGTIDNATSGEVYIQGFYLNPYLSALENVIVPMRINPDIPAKEWQSRALALLEDFGVKEQADSLPSQMS